MKINDLVTFVGGLIDKKVYVPTLAVGGMGLGKSQAYAQIAKARGMRLIDLRLAQMEASDLIGMPYRDDKGMTQWAKPGWWPTTGEKCLILLDELNRAPTDVRQGAFQLILDRKLHTHTLPEDCYVHSAMNPNNGEFQVEELDKAMIRRFCVLKIDGDTDVWLQWAKGQGGIQDNLTEFVATNRGLLFLQEEFKIEVKPTPDSYRMLNDMMKVHAIPVEYQSEVFGGIIGPEASVALIKWMAKNYNKPVSGTQILNEYAKVKDKLTKQGNAENYATITDLIACLTEKKTVDAKQLDNIGEFTLNLPKDAQPMVITKLPRHVRDPLLKNPKISKLLIDIVSNEEK